MRAGLSILAFHRVLREPDALFPEVIDAARFDTTLRWLARFFRVIPLKEGIDALFDGRLGRRSVAITFDDGYADNVQVATPLLRAHGMHATFFVASGFLGGGRMWNDTVIESLRIARDGEVDLGAWGLSECNMGSPAARRVIIDRLLMALKYLPPEERDAGVKQLRGSVAGTLPDNLMMTPAQLRQLADSGMEIGAHTVNHPILARLDNESARAEITKGRNSLEEIIGRKIHLFAYPNGRPGEDYGDDHVAMVRELGFSAAVSTILGTARTSDDRFQLPRFTPWDKNPIGFSLRLAAQRLHYPN